MNRPEIEERLREHATELAIDDFEIEEYTELVQVSWQDEDGFERNVSVRDTGDKLGIECNIWYDDYDALERSWHLTEIAEVSPEYPTVLTEALYRAFEVALNTERDELEVVDGLAPEETAD